MRDGFLDELNIAFGKCSDSLLHDEYVSLLNELTGIQFTQDVVEFICERVTSKKQIWELRFAHLKILLLNHSTADFNLKSYFEEAFKKSRRLTMKLFLLRGYAIYANEDEIEPLVKKFCEVLGKNHDYIDYEHILSAPGLPYLMEKYGYECFHCAYRIAISEYDKIDPLLRGYFTLDENMNHINLLSMDEIKKRTHKYLEGLDRK